MRCSTSAAQQNAYLESPSRNDYAAWHLGLTADASDETKARYAFVYGDLRRGHRTGLIACVSFLDAWQQAEALADKAFGPLDPVQYKRKS